MTRRGALLACLLAPFAQELRWNTLKPSHTFMRLWMAEKPTDKLLEICWSDGTSVTFTEAQIRKELEGR